MRAIDFRQKMIYILNTEVKNRKKSKAKFVFLNVD